MLCLSVDAERVIFLDKMDSLFSDENYAIAHAFLFSFKQPISSLVVHFVASTF